MDATFLIIKKTLNHNDKFLLLNATMVGLDMLAPKGFRLSMLTHTHHLTTNRGQHKLKQDPFSRLP